MARGLAVLLAFIPALLCYGEGKPVNEQWFALNSYGDIWKNCGTPKDHAKITNVSIVPDPPVVGQQVNISATLSTNEVITGGTVDIEATYSDILPYSFHYNICDLTAKIHHPCPLPKGTVKIFVPAKIPKEAPKGDYEGKVTALDQNKQQLACLSLKLTLK